MKPTYLVYFMDKGKLYYIQSYAQIVMRTTDRERAQRMDFEEVERFISKYNNKLVRALYRNTENDFRLTNLSYDSVDN